MGNVCLLALQLVPAVRSTRTTPPMQCRHWGSKMAFLPLTAFVVETLRLSCPAAGAEVPGLPVRVPGYLVAQAQVAPWNRQAGVITRSRHTWDGQTWCF